MIEQLAKKEWTEPELIVLVRNKPEEAVLGACKTVQQTEGPSSRNEDCCVEDGGCIPCGATVPS